MLITFTPLPPSPCKDDKHVWILSPPSNILSQNSRKAGKEVDMRKFPANRFWIPKMGLSID
jgi:hypothetical protein